MDKLEEGLCLVNLVLAIPFLTLKLLPLLLYLSILICLYSEKDSDYKYRESQLLDRWFTRKTLRKDYSRCFACIFCTVMT